MGWSSFLGFPLALVSSDFRDGSFQGIFYDWNAAYFFVFILFAFMQYFDV